MKKKTTYATICHNEVIWDELTDPTHHVEDAADNTIVIYGDIVRHSLWLCQNTSHKKLKEIAFTLLMQWGKYVRDESGERYDTRRVMEQNDWLSKQLLTMCNEIRSRYNFDEYDDYVRNIGKTEFQMLTLGEMMHTELDKIPAHKRLSFKRVSEKAKRLWDYGEGDRKSFL
jgi:hypothetical protein